MEAFGTAESESSPSSLASPSSSSSHAARLPPCPTSAFCDASYRSSPAALFLALGAVLDGGDSPRKHTTLVARARYFPTRTLAL